MHSTEIQADGRDGEGSGHDVPSSWSTLGRGGTQTRASGVAPTRASSRPGPPERERLPGSSFPTPPFLPFRLLVHQIHICLYSLSVANDNPLTRTRNWTKKSQGAYFNSQHRSASPRLVASHGVSGCCCQLARTALFCLSSRRIKVRLSDRIS